MVIFNKIALEIRINGICNIKLKRIIKGYIILKKPGILFKENPSIINGIKIISTIG